MRIVGTVTAVHEASGKVETRRVRFEVEAGTPWVDIVDEATDRAFPVGSWIFDDEQLSEVA